MKNIALQIFDIGKTHSKISLVNSANGELLTSIRHNNKSYQVKGYKAIDIEAIWEWFLEQTTILTKQYSITEIIVTTHGASAAIVNEDGLLLPVMDYEFDDFSSINENYNNERALFEETGSLNLSMGLNLGRQLYWLQNKFPGYWKKAQWILMLPQYFNWKLSGKAVSELTSLGCHTDLWCYKEHCYSDLVKHCQWQHLFPEMAGCGEVLSNVSKDICSKTGLSLETKVLNGIHDSNASLVPYIQSKKKPLNIISTGTWSVIFSMGAEVPRLDENSEMMVSMSYQGKAIPSIRFMGGREWENLQTGEDYQIEDIEQLIKLSCYPLPSFTQAGPFAENAGIIVGEHLLSPSQRAAVGTLYLALMTRYCLDLLSNGGDIVIEGSFIQNIEYMSLLQNLSKQQKVFISNDISGTTLGAARLSDYSKHWPKVNLSAVEAVNVVGLEKYYKNWILRIKNLKE